LKCHINFKIISLYIKRGNNHVRRIRKLGLIITLGLMCIFSGGLEELIKCLQNVMVLNIKKMIEYLKIYDKNILYLKVGYIFSNFVQEINIKHLIDECEKYKTNKKYYVETNKQRYNILSKEWNLILPEEIQQYTFEEQCYE